MTGHARQGVWSLFFERLKICWWEWRTRHRSIPIVTWKRQSWG